MDWESVYVDFLVSAVSGTIWRILYIAVLSMLLYPCNWSRGRSKWFVFPHQDKMLICRTMNFCWRSPRCSTAWPILFLPPSLYTNSALKKLTYILECTDYISLNSSKNNVDHVFCLFVFLYFCCFWLFSRKERGQCWLTESFYTGMQYYLTLI